MDGKTSEQRKFLRELARSVINVAERPPGLRGPWIFDETELQARAADARRYLNQEPPHDDL